MTTSTDLPAGDTTFDGVPFPVNGALFGWRPGGGDVAALIQFSTRPEPQDPVMTVLPRTDVPEMTWEPVARPRFGTWFWDYYRSGQIADLSGLVGGTDGIVFWVDTIAAVGSGSFAVESDLRSPDGWLLPRGAYVYFRALRGGNALALDVLVNAPGKVDLGQRFPAGGGPS